MPVGDFDCPECGQPGAHFVPPSLGEPGLYYCAASPVAQAKRAKDRAREARLARHGPAVIAYHGNRLGRRPPRRLDLVVRLADEARREALQELAIDVFDPPPSEPRDPLARWDEDES